MLWSIKKSISTLAVRDTERATYRRSQKNEIELNKKKVT